MTVEGKCKICGKESDNLEFLLTSSLDTIWVCPECYKKISDMFDDIIGDMFDAIYGDEESEGDGI